MFKSAVGKTSSIVGSRAACRRVPSQRCPNSQLPQPRHFRFRVLGRFDWIVRRGNAAASHQLDLACAVPQLLSRSHAYLIWAVGDGCDTLDFGVAQRTTQSPRNLKEKPEVSMPRGFRDESARGVDARNNHYTFVDGAFETGPPTSRTVVKSGISVASACRAANRWR